MGTGTGLRQFLCQGKVSDQHQGVFYVDHPTDRMAQTSAFVAPVVEHWLEREIAQWVHHEGSIRDVLSASLNKTFPFRYI